MGHQLPTPDQDQDKQRSDSRIHNEPQTGESASQFSREELEALTYNPPPPSSGQDEGGIPDTTGHQESENEVESSSERYPRRDSRATSFYSRGSARFARALEALASRMPDPSSLSEAFSQEDTNQWRDAIKSELGSVRQHKTWEVVAWTEGAKVFSTRFVFLHKYNERGLVVRHQARLVVRGFQQGNVEHTFVPVVDFKTMRNCLSVARY